MDESEPRTERWDTISFVISSDYRLLVLDQLAAGPEIPSRITADDREHVLTEHISRALGELLDRELVELRVPDEREKYRFFPRYMSRVVVCRDPHSESLADVDDRDGSIGLRA